MFYYSIVCAQIEQKNKFKIQGYGEMYYSESFPNFETSEKPDFIFNHKKNNSLSVNLAFIKASYTKQNFRSTISMMFGDYSRYNLQNEPNWAKPILEANAGFKISKTKNIWIDAGVLPSHIGFESAISTDCHTLTRSILAENSPYFETGLKITYTSKSETFYGSVLIVNGWQKIETSKFTKHPALGFQLNFKPSTFLTLNYSNFFGTEKADSLHSFRLFHNLYAIYEPNKKISCISGLDIGTDKYNKSKYGVWFSPVIILRYKPKDKISVALREEYYSDPNQLMIITNTKNGFQTFGTSINFDFQIANNFLWRIEGKSYLARDTIFNNSNTLNIITSSIAIKI